MREGVTTITVLTPAGRGAVASVSVNGPQAVQLVDRHFLPASARGIGDRPACRIVFGRWVTGDACSSEELVVCRLGDDHIEVHCHGGVAAVEAITESLVTEGGVRQEAVAWALRNCSNTIQAEARLALAKATTERTALILLDQFHGAFEREVAAILALLQRSELLFSAKRLSRLIERIPVGLHLTTPWRIAISGPPNVGKSTLMNALIGYSRSIVFDQPGTTRDLVTANTAFDGWPMQLIDTAGIRQTDDLLEFAGINQTRRAVREADLELSICDVTDSHYPTTELGPAPPRLKVVNKVDLHAGVDLSGQGIKLSAKTGAGLPRLISEVLTLLVGVFPSSGDPIPFTPRQVALLWQANSAVELASAKNAADYLEQIIG